MSRSFKVIWVQITAITPHPLIQRSFDEKWAKHIAETFDPDAFHAATIVPREGKPGYYWALNGQHRIAAARMALGDDQKVPCFLHEGLSEAQQAALCNKLNDSRRWRAVPTFLTDVLAREPEALAINAIIQKHGLKVGERTAPGIVRAVVACEWVYRRLSGEVLDRTLKILHQAWPDYAEALDNVLLRGMALFLNRHPGIDDAHLMRRLMAHGSPVYIIGRGRNYARMAGQTSSRGVVTVLVGEYNKGLRGNARLPDGMKDKAA